MILGLMAGGVAVGVMLWMARRRAKAVVQPSTARIADARDDSHEMQLRLARDHARRRDWAAALPHYQAVIGDGTNLDIALGLANAQLRTGDPAAALATLDAMPPVPIQAEPEKVALLRADVLAALGRKAEAADAYAELLRYAPHHAPFAYAALLVELGRPEEARSALEAVEARAAEQGQDDLVERARAMLAELIPDR